MSQFTSGFGEKNGYFIETQVIYVGDKMPGAKYSTELLLFSFCSVHLGFPGYSCIEFKGHVYLFYAQMNTNNVDTSAHM